MRFIISLFLLSLGFTGLVKASEANVIKLAVSNVTEGPASQLGIRLNQGANVYFSRANQTNALPGYQIQTEHKDDGYEPFKTLQNTHLFVEQGDFFGFLNYVGTPTTQAVYQKVSKSGLPFLTPFTGAKFLRMPVTDNIYNLRASYYQEAKAQLDYLVKTKGFKSIGFLIQADSFGYSVENGFIDVLKSYRMVPAITTRYRRNTEDIDTALMLLKKHNVDAIVFVGTYLPFADLINKADKLDFHPFFSTVSFISSADLFPLITTKNDVLVTEVFPDPNTCNKAYCQQFNADMKAAGYTEVDRIQLEGYLNALLFVEVAKLCTNNMTPQCFLEKIQHFSLQKLDLDIHFSDDDHQGLNDVFLNFYTPRAQ